MKKALIMAIAGIALSVASSFADGYIVMQNYVLVGGTTPVFSAVTYTNGGNYVSEASGFKADLLYSLDGGMTYSLASGSETSFYPGSTDSGSPTTDGAGVFVGGSVVLSGYTSGSVTFILRVFNGTSYGTSTIAGQSAPFTISSIQTNPLSPAGDILAISGTTATGLQPFSLY